jgi:hypothetical protein
MSLDTPSSRGGPTLARRALAPLPALPQPAVMPTRSASVRDLAVTATLLYIYVGARGTALALGAARTVMAR